MADMRHMNAYLVRAARLQPAAYQRRQTRKALVHAVAGDGAAAAGAGYGLFLPVLQVAIQGEVDDAHMGIRHAPDKRIVFAKQRPRPAVIGELRGEPPMRRVVLGDDQEPRRVLVEPVDDARPLDPADARQAVPAMRQKGIHQGS
jgi:hypothetical protein